ncbi:alkaline phosphatase family protein [Erythrobacter sp. 3-20A1M]|uniref:alkaline phosphatase family protein n=1 Tax=Erythrobacter sp. 3-20A1M TaxID=2653850 RepID=UPI001BFC9325|nr:alkaline phosphatase family protein [Erythrobacter sp. 3-20A1M]
MSAKLLVMGLAGLDLDTLDAAMRRGALPTLARLAGRAQVRPLVSPVPPLSIAAWATLSSGVMPDEHGLLLTEEPGPSGLRPAGKASWRIAPVWERLSDAGMQTASLGWPGTLPGATWTGTHIDPRFGEAEGLGRDDWPLPLDVAPDAFRQTLRELRVHPAELPRQLLAPLLTEADADPEQRAARERKVALAIARLASLHPVATELLETAGAEAIFLYQDWFEAACAALGVESPADLPPAAWFLFDQTLQQILQLVSDDCTVMVLSPGARSAGFLIARGERFPPGTRAAGLSTLGVPDLVLAEFGLDASRGGSSGADESAAAPITSRSLDDLLALAPLHQPQVRAWHMRYRLAEAELALARDPARAAELARAILTDEPDNILACGILASALVALEDGVAELPELAARIARQAPDHVWADLINGAYYAARGDARRAEPHLERAEQSPSPDDRLRVGLARLMLGQGERAAGLFRAVLDEAPYNAAALQALLATELPDADEAETLLARLLAIMPDHPQARAAWTQLAQARMARPIPR